MHINTDADYCVGQALGFEICLNKNAAGFAWADEQIVGPAQVDRSNPETARMASAAARPAAKGNSASRDAGICGRRRTLT